MSVWLSIALSTVCLLGFASMPARANTAKSVMDTSKAGMEQVSKALGVDCVYCHPTKKADGKRDFKAPSPLKATARYMQVHIVNALVQKDSQPLTCATCHRGRATFLPRDTTQTLPSRLVGMSRTEIVDLMKSMQHGLGVQTCDGCHTRRRDGRLDPVTPTPGKVTARYMMDHHAGELFDQKTGKPATCVTCHRGKVKFLPRHE